MPTDHPTIPSCCDRAITGSLTGVAASAWPQRIEQARKGYRDETNVIRARRSYRAWQLTRLIEVKDSATDVLIVLSSFTAGVLVDLAATSGASGSSHSGRAIMKTHLLFVLIASIPLSAASAQADPSPRKFHSRSRGIEPGGYADPYYGRANGQRCPRWCEEDRNPCDPPHFKEADGRCFNR
jgi:hypothetical protein